MSKAEKAALDWLPKRKDGRKKCYRCNDDDIRSVYARGYRKAEKDLELTWEDVRRIYLIVNSTMNDVGMDNLTDKSIYQEVLKRFKELKRD